MLWYVQKVQYSIKTIRLFTFFTTDWSCFFVFSTKETLKFIFFSDDYIIYLLVIIANAPKRRFYKYNYYQTRWKLGISSFIMFI